MIGNAHRLRAMATLSSHAPNRRDARYAVTLVELLVVLAIVALLIGLTVLAVQYVRAAATRANCANHLRQMALALHHHHDAYRRFPPGVSSAGSFPL